MKLVEQMKRHCVTDGAHATAIPGLQLIRFSSPGGAMPMVYEPSICLPVQGRKRVVAGSVEYEQRPLELSIMPVTIAVVTEASPDEPYLCVVADLGGPRMAGVLPATAMAMAMAMAPAGEKTSAGLFTRAAPALVVETFERLVRLLDQWTFPFRRRCCGESWIIACCPASSGGGSDSFCQRGGGPPDCRSGAADAK